MGDHILLNGTDDTNSMETETKRYAHIVDNVVVNVSMWDGNTATWQPPDGETVVQSDFAGVGDWYETSEDVFYRPLPKSETNTPQG